MAISVASVTTTAINTTNPYVVSLPSGLVDGNLMVMFLMGVNSAGSITTPTGWTLIDTVDDTATEGNYAKNFWKIATAADVSAGTVSVTQTLTRIMGVTARITGFDSYTPINAHNSANDDTNATSYSINASITPTLAECLIIQFWGSPSARSGSGYAIATGDITWTEGADFTGASGGNLAIQMAYGNRTPTTATGNGSITLSGAATSCLLMMFAISPQNGNFFLLFQ